MGFGLVFNQFRVRQSLCQQQLEHRVAEHVRVLAVVEPELKFIAVSVKVLCRDLMIRADDRTLEKRPYVLYGVGMNFASNVLAGSMPYRFVFGVLICDATVSGPFVGIDSFGVAASISSDEAVQGFPIRAAHYLEADVPAALHSTYHHGFVALVPTSLAVHLATDEGLIHFNDALQELRVNFIQSGAYAVAQVPCGFVAHPKSALHLISGDSLFGLYDKINCKEPLPEWKVRVVKDSASGNGESVAA